MSNSQKQGSTDSKTHGTIKGKQAKDETEDSKSSNTKELSTKTAADQSDKAGTHKPKSN